MEPALRWKMGEAVDRDEIRSSERVRRILAAAEKPGVYAKWQGAHWALAALADLGYPPGDEALHPLRERVLAAWLDESYYVEFEATSKAAAYRRRGVPVMAGRHRRCASQQGNTLWYLTRLGLADERCDALAERLLHWQWPDGGWNCDKSPAAATSSFHETLLPMRGLAAHGLVAEARRAAEVFLSRRLAFRISDGSLIHPSFVQLHYPLYWHYDILGGLKALSDLDLLGDPRCADALDLLDSLRIEGGWPAQARYYTGSSPDAVDWGGVSARRPNPWVTADARAVLKAAGIEAKRSCTPSR
ncbi:hypothetical protein [Paractinoplanes atraurantiacus]|uniref:Prenyltransferase and squalene oxidase repeat-containing protein n=1 Tax=Paractinoplanes atraurantiacus TaxID=1036182 RepID=A0A285K731_9ACTN|nr:hypothetical protein [Actinoplanes atraurantiacus]SNY68348.1 hypothetical protein SAMN05421748_1336 [Actinoplanes atraurantiacus]